MKNAKASSRTRRCDIALLVDEEIGERDGKDRFVVEARSMEASVLRALKGLHHGVRVVPFDPKIVPTIDELRRLNPRLVFNLTEWVSGDRRLDSAITGILEMMKLRYTGAGPEGMQLARDKALAKSIVADLGIEVPAHALVNGRLPAASSIPLPAIVKPQFGDGSDGIGRSALVRSPRALLERVRAIRRRGPHEALMCEAFVPGRDLFVALLGNEPRVIPPIELVVGRPGAGAPAFSTYKVKNDARYQRKWRLGYRQAELPAEVIERIDDASRRIFRALKLRDYARLDYRLTPDNRLFFLEANPNPDLARNSFGRDPSGCARCFAGVPYPELIATIVRSALARTT